MKRRLLSAALLAGLSLAAATNAPKLSLEQQAVRAEVIVRATVETSSSVQESGQTWTVYPLTILETVAGDAQSLPKYQNKPSVWVLSGVQDAPSLSSGDTMLLLYKERYDSPLVGFNQGKYSLQSLGAGGAAAKVVTGLPDGTPGVTSSVPLSDTLPASTPPAVTVPNGAAPNSAAPNNNLEPGAAAPAADSVAPAPASGAQANLAQSDSVQASASSSVSSATPAVSPSAAASAPAPSSSAAAPAVSETSATASADPASASEPSAAPASQKPAAPAPSAPTLPPVPEVKTTDSMPVPVPNNPVPGNAVPNNSAAPPAVPSAAAPLPAGQMTLEAFRKLVLDARAKAGK